MSAREEVKPFPRELAQMSKVQKLAVLLVVLGRDTAAELLKKLTEEEVEAVAKEISRIEMVDAQLQKEILTEFNEVVIEASTAILGGLPFAQQTLERSLGLFRASDLVTRLSPSRAPVAAMEQIAEMEPRQVVNLIKSEQPQTIALLVSYLPSEKGALVLGMLRNELREQVVERLATLAPTPIEVVERVVEMLNQKVGSKNNRLMSKTGGLKSAADLLNAMEKNASKSLLIGLEERNPELGQAIRQKMFIFEDLASLDTTVLQKILREIDMRDLAISLKTASDKLKTALLSSISKRAAETIKEEMAFMGPLKLKEIESAQQRIIEVVRRLESEGEIELETENNVEM